MSNVEYIVRTNLLVFVVLLLRPRLYTCKPLDLVAHYENVINTASADALAFQLPEDAKIYEASDKTITDFGDYDFVIIGAGSTGSVIANRLSEIHHWKVLLLEAGKFKSEVTDIPSLYALSVFSEYNWGFRSVPQKTACLGVVEEKCLEPRGRGLGGTTLFNGLVYSRGHPTDFNKWAKHVGDPSWSYKNVLKYFKKSENFHHNDPEAPVDWKYHGIGGYLNVEYSTPSIPFKYIFLEANKELGYNITDYNSPFQIGASTVQFNTKDGRRDDHGTAFILPIMKRKSLKVLTESYVTKIEVNKTLNAAKSVIFTRKGKTYRVIANKEVILSAGAISSPHILMVSGIGPKRHLEELGIPLVKNLPVGNVLREHISPYGIQFSASLSAPNQTLTQTIIDFLHGTGSLTSNTLSHVIGWYKSSIDQTYDYPDIELVTDLSGPNTALGQKFLGWKNETWNALWGNNTSASFYTNAVLLHGLSVGSVKLNSSSPFVYPLIDFNFLSDPENKDIDTLYEAIQLIMDIINTKAFQRIGAKFESNPLPACKDYEYLSKQYWYCFIRQTTLAVYHPVGSCPMGKNPAQGAVVDSELKVFGIKKLRVADSSVFPFTISAHPSATCTMIGEKISDIIKSKYLD